MTKTFFSILAIATLIGFTSPIGAETPEVDLKKGFGGPSPLVVPAAAFTTKGNDASSHKFELFFGYLAGTNSSGGCVQAPVYLPYGATVTEVHASVIDNDDANNIFISLLRRSNYDHNAVDEMAFMQSTGQSSSVTTIGDLAVSNPFIDFPQYSYYLTTCLASSTTRLYSVRVYFLQPLFADGFESGETWVWSSNPSK